MNAEAQRPYRRAGVLLVNLGSPESTRVDDVREYLREFLSDPRVLDIPELPRKAVLNLFILPFRPKKSAEAYETIWTPEGSPLILTTKRVAALLAEKTELPIEVGMRYGNPSIASAISALVNRGVDHIFLIPLYPHYAMSSYETVVARTQEILEEHHPTVGLTIQPPFFNDPDYIEALMAPALPYLEQDYDHILFSYHGVPERHIRKGDPSGCYCLRVKDCCNTAHPAQAMCYRAQCVATTREFAKRAGIPKDKYTVTFQSRLGRDPWLKPYTDETLERLPSANVKRLLVISPAFVADCLETLEEIAEEGRETFMEAGGKQYDMIPCMNEHPRWIEVLAKFVQQFESGHYALGNAP